MSAFQCTAAVVFMVVSSTLNFVNIVKLLVCVEQQVEAGPATTRLLSQLFVNYSVNSIPVANDSEAIYVIVEFDLTQIIDLDLKDELFRANLWITLTWNDYQLNWNPADYDGVDNIVLPDTMIWTPTILLMNSITGADDKIIFSKVRIYNTGDVMWLRVGQFSSSCDVNVEWFPLDQQTCSMTFVSWDDESQVLLDDSGPSSSPQEAEYEGEWKIIAKTTNASSRVLMKKYYYQTAVFSVRVQRLPLFYITNLIIPCALISCLTVMAFVLPPDEGDKIGLSITVLLTLTVYLMIVADYVPTTPQAVPLIDVYFMVLIVMSTLSVVASVVIVSLHNRSPVIHKMPHWVRTVFCRGLAWFLHIRIHGPATSEDCTRHTYRRNSDDFEDVGDIQLEGSSTDMPMVNMKGPPSHTSSILKELRCITAKMHNEAIHDELADEWKLVAMVIDRLCLWGFGLTFVIGTIVVFVRVPTYG